MSKLESEKRGAFSKVFFLDRCSLDGRRMLLSEDRRVLSVLPGEASRALANLNSSNVAAFWDRESSFFDQERRALVLKTSKAETFVILRDGSVDLGVFGGKVWSGEMFFVILSNRLICWFFFFSRELCLFC